MAPDYSPVAFAALTVGSFAAGRRLESKEDLDMNNGQYRTLSKRIVDALSVDGKDAVFGDRDLPGFGVRVYPSNAKVYVVQTRAFGRSKRITLGRHGEVSADQARKETIRIIARIKAGEFATPAEPSATPTVGDLAERYELRPALTWNTPKDAYGSISRNCPS